MPRLLTTISFSIASAMVFIPQVNGGNAKVHPSITVAAPKPIYPNAYDIIIPAIYDSMQLKKLGLSREAFKYAFIGYSNLMDRGRIKKDGLLTICDFSQSSKRKRLYLLDINNFNVVLNTYVAHGKRSGGEYARAFSNKPRSHQSSIGFYITRNTYHGEHGLSLKLDGLDRGYNCKAQYRNIVVHGSTYVGESYLSKSSYMGRSFGCPAVPQKYNATLINTIKNGSLLFIYYPDKKYLNSSTVLKG